MRKIRISIGRLMAFILIFSLGLAGLRNADETWANACFSLMIVAFVVAILTAIQSRGKDRAYWVGFAIAGSAYATLGFVLATIESGDGPLNPAPRFVTHALFDRLEPVIHPELKNLPPSIPRLPVGVSLGFIPPKAALASSLPSAPPPPPLLPPVIPTSWPAMAMPRSTIAYFSTPASELARVHYLQVAHSLIALLAGMIGGPYSVWLWNRRERREAEVSPSSP
jgi:hypothetical protein